jgi:hypothetical protein
MKIIGFLAAFLFFTGTVRAQEYLNCHFAPGWEQSGAKHEYIADNLYDYKDGGSEGYLIYGFVRMQGINCKSGENSLVIDVSEMSDADASYGIFAANRGMGGQIQKQGASFAKGKYYVEIVVIDTNQDNDRTAFLESFVSKMQEHLKGRDTAPEALGWFSKEDLASAQLVPESVLGLRLLKRGYIAKYKQGQAFIVPEDSPQSAAEIMKKLRDRFTVVSSTKIGDEAFLAKAQYLDGICVFRKGRYLAGYANLPEPQQAASQATKLAARIP